MSESTRCFAEVDDGVRWAPLVVPPRLDGRTLDRLLPMLVGMNEDWLSEAPWTPPLYSTGVVYMRDEPGREQWVSIPWVLLRGWGDCKSLACWRVAELRHAGENASAFWSVRKTPAGLLYHVQVRRADGNVEDPSLRRGMAWAEPGIAYELG